MSERTRTVDADSYEAGYADGWAGAEKQKRADLEQALYGPSSFAEVFPAGWRELLAEAEKLRWMVAQMRDSERMIAEANWASRGEDH